MLRVSFRATVVLHMHTGASVFISKMHNIKAFLTMWLVSLKQFLFLKHLKGKRKHVEGKTLFETTCCWRFNYTHTLTQVPLTTVHLQFSLVLRVFICTGEPALRLVKLYIQQLVINSIMIWITLHDLTVNDDLIQFSCRCFKQHRFPCSCLDEMRYFLHHES